MFTLRHSLCQGLSSPLLLTMGNHRKMEPKNPEGGHLLIVTIHISSLDRWQHCTWWIYQSVLANEILISTLAYLSSDMTHSTNLTFECLRCLMLLCNRPESSGAAEACWTPYLYLNHLLKSITVPKWTDYSAIYNFRQQLKLLNTDTKTERFVCTVGG